MFNGLINIQVGIGKKKRQKMGVNCLKRNWLIFVTYLPIFRIFLIPCCLRGITLVHTDLNWYNLTRYLA